MQIDITINKGRGYVPADENQYCTDVNVIPIDSIYTPIRNVKYQVENFRVEQKTDYEKLVLEITTDGSIHPKEALKEAAKILIYHFMLFSDERLRWKATMLMVMKSLMKKYCTCVSCWRLNLLIWISFAPRLKAADVWDFGHLYNSIRRICWNSETSERNRLPSLMICWKVWICRLKLIFLNIN